MVLPIIACYCFLLLIIACYCLFVAEVVLDKRVKRNLALQDVPAVVSRIDLESENINVPWPADLLVAAIGGNRYFDEVIANS